MTKPKDISNFEIFDRSTQHNYSGKSALLKLEVKRRRIRLNMQCVKLLNLQKEMYVRFFRFGKEWFIVVTTDASGYAASLDEGTRAGACISAAVVMNQISMDLKKTEFYLQETEHEHKGRKLFELLAVPETKS